MPFFRVLLSPRRRARARFSSMPIVAAVPFMGSWNTRPRKAARLCSGYLVTLTPSMRICPSSTFQVPAMALRRVDFPAPFPPMTVTKSPSFKVRSSPFRACFSLTVPGLKVFEIWSISSIRNFLPSLQVLKNTAPAIRGWPGKQLLQEQIKASEGPCQCRSRSPPEVPGSR